MQTLAILINGSSGKSNKVLYHTSERVFTIIRRSCNLAWATFVPDGKYV